MSKLDDGMIVSTRVRLARNLSGIHFPLKMTSADNQILSDRIMNRVNPANEFTVYRMNELSDVERQVLVERHLASSELILRPEGLLLLSGAENVSVLVGEEDHVRIQCILSGWKLPEADNLTRAIDTIIAPEGYAFDDQIGYLTSCPTNVGTGMRASVMMHLAGLTLTNQIPNIAEMVGKFGFTIRGYYGEGSSAYGAMYQLSNQITLGVSEDDILSNLTQIVYSITEKERAMREMLMKNDRGTLQDRLHRSLGILKYARRLSAEEMMSLVSDIKLGLSLKIFDGISCEEVDRVVTNLQPASIAAHLGQESGNETQDEARAKAMRIAIKDCVVF